MKITKSGTISFKANSPDSELIRAALNSHITICNNNIDYLNKGHTEQDISYYISNGKREIEYWVGIKKAAAQMLSEITLNR